MFDGDCCEQSHPWVFPCRIRRKGRKAEHLGAQLPGPFFLCLQCFDPAPARGGWPELGHPDLQASPARKGSPEKRPEIGRFLRPEQFHRSTGH
ncbi:MAG: hypothetical protein PWP61_1245 [Trichococcus sp.]|jgi:hypothetical protein|nr:hypothetical protein [Trichococcus sp.]